MIRMKWLVVFPCLLCSTLPPASAEEDPTTAAIAQWQKTLAPVYRHFDTITKKPEYKQWLEAYNQVHSLSPADPDYPRYRQKENTLWKSNAPLFRQEAEEELATFLKDSPRYRAAEFAVLELMAKDLRHHLESMSQAGLFDFWSSIEPERMIDDIWVTGFAAPTTYLLRQKRYLSFFQKDLAASARVTAVPIVRDCTPAEAARTAPQFQEDPKRKVIFVGFFLHCDSHASLVTVAERWEESSAHAQFLLKGDAGRESDGLPDPPPMHDFLQEGHYKFLIFGQDLSKDVPEIKRTSPPT